MKFFLDFMEKAKKDTLYLSVVFIVTGFILIIFPNLTLNVFCMVLGALIIASGINSIIKNVRDKENQNSFSLILGVFLVIIGINFISVASLFVNIIASIFGILIIINGIRQIKDALEKKKYYDKNWLWMLVLAIITVAFGLAITIINPYTLSGILIKVMGICLIYCGVTNLIIHQQIKKDLDSLSDDE